MLSNSLLPLIEDLKTVPGVRAIVLGGSRARGSGDASSDTDLGIYYDPESPLDTTALNLVASRRDDRKEPGLVTSIGGWGPWINGGGWLRVDGSAVDLLYRDMSRVGSVIDNCIGGNIEVAYQPGHPLGFFSSIYTAEVAVCQALWDPTGWVASSKKYLIDYPEALRRELVRRFGFEAGFCLLIAEKPVRRADVNYVAGCVFRAVSCVLVVLFALNREHWLNEKGALRLAARFPIVPPGFSERVETIWRSVVNDSDSLTSALTMIRGLNDEVKALVEKEGLRFGT
ncbi:MAG: nucleotidyltransferase domain-containing protein [Verrucomicrobia bacterium]|nr:nucleotidyltransferase domain-containing protein [Verrucomicrobiota bacterium]